MSLTFVLNDEVKRKKYDEELAEKRQKEESSKFSNNSYTQKKRMN